MHFRANVASGIFSGYRADDGRAVVRLDGVLLEGFLALWVGSSPCFDWGCKGPNSAQTALALLDWSGIPGARARLLAERYAAAVLDRIPSGEPWVISANAIRSWAARQDEDRDPGREEVADRGGGDHG